MYEKLYPKVKPDNAENPIFGYTFEDIPNSDDAGSVFLSHLSALSKKVSSLTSNLLNKETDLEEKNKIESFSSKLHTFLEAVCASVVQLNSLFCNNSQIQEESINIDNQNISTVIDKISRGLDNLTNSFINVKNSLDKFFNSVNIQDIPINIEKKICFLIEYCNNIAKKNFCPDKIDSSSDFKASEISSIKFLREIIDNLGGNSSNYSNNALILKQAAKEEVEKAQYLIKKLQVNKIDKAVMTSDILIYTDLSFTGSPHSPDTSNYVKPKTSENTCFWLHDYIIKAESLFQITPLCEELTQESLNSRFSYLMENIFTKYNHYLNHYNNYKKNEEKLIVNAVPLLSYKFLSAPKFEEILEQIIIELKMLSKEKLKKQSDFISDSDVILIIYNKIVCIINNFISDSSTEFHFLLSQLKINQEYLSVFSDKEPKKSLKVDDVHDALMTLENRLSRVFNYFSTFFNISNKNGSKISTNIETFDNSSSLTLLAGNDSNYLNQALFKLAQLITKTSFILSKTYSDSFVNNLNIVKPPTDNIIEMIDIVEDRINIMQNFYQKQTKKVNAGVNWKKTLEDLFFSHFPILLSDISESIACARNVLSFDSKEKDINIAKDKINIENLNKLSDLEKATYYQETISILQKDTQLLKSYCKHLSSNYRAMHQRLSNYSNSDQQFRKKWKKLIDNAIEMSKLVGIDTCSLLGFNNKDEIDSSSHEDFFNFKACTNNALESLILVVKECIGKFSNFDPKFIQNCQLDGKIKRLENDSSQYATEKLLINKMLNVMLKNFGNIGISFEKIYYCFFGYFDIEIDQMIEKIMNNYRSGSEKNDFNDEDEMSLVSIMKNIVYLSNNLSFSVEDHLEKQYTIINYYLQTSNILFSLIETPEKPIDAIKLESIKKNIVSIDDKLINISDCVLMAINYRKHEICCKK